MIPPKKLLVLDVGSIYVGMASIDSLWRVATPVGIFKRRLWSEDRLRWQTIIREGQYEGIIVGIPWLQDGGLNHQTRRVLGFKNTLKNAVGLPIAGQDEFLSTHEAHSMQGSKKQRERIDHLAALEIARRWITHYEHS